MHRFDCCYTSGANNECEISKAFGGVVLEYFGRSSGRCISLHDTRVAFGGLVNSFDQA
jgi:hypothetical protein